jgi:hypothetical protein
MMTVGMLSLVAAGSMTLVGGTALADCGCGGGSTVAGNTGGSGTGGTATNNCLNVGVPILSGIGIAGTGAASGASCLATANGTGGNAS